ncbi:flavodoxin family protein [Staphylococcus agnetis]|uniref:flavodoxin family protein n=1 Tax=Staphylococcus agnetis TaxID=985762 RepID=UPI0018F8AC4B|nr:NAD(P)H-dependent oxidoreductase [Staphylococcus agnetis]
MKKIFVFIGSRRKSGNTATFIKNVTNKLDTSKYIVEFAFPQDYNIHFNDGSDKQFFNTSYNLNDDLKILQNKILESDVLIIGSPVYVHSMSADLKLFLERSSWWAHTLRLQGKPVIVMSTCGSNGLKTVIGPLSEVMTFMGGNVIATANATQIPDRLNDKLWIEEVTNQIVDRIVEYSKLPNQSNQFLEKVFKGSKLQIMEQLKVEEEAKINSVVLGELEFWKKTGMINYDTFKDYLEKEYRK